jgi:muscarinic acetylcholine receptor M3
MNSGDKEKVKEETILIKAPVTNFFQRIATPIRTGLSRRPSQKGKTPTAAANEPVMTTSPATNATFVRASSTERPLSTILASEPAKVKVANETEGPKQPQSSLQAGGQLKVTPSSTLTAMTASSGCSPKQPVQQEDSSSNTRPATKATTGTNTTAVVGSAARQAIGVVGGNAAAKRKKPHDNRARKALRTITFILGAFIFCFAPWHVVSVYNSFCTDCFNSNIYHHFFYSCYFLCYLNSPINPFMYALANQQFKKTFTRILKGDFRKM